MTRSVTDSLAASVAGSLNQIGAFIDAAPDAVWSAKTGGWPAWQHVVHSVMAGDLFTPGDPVPAPAGLTPDVLGLKAKAEGTLPKDEARKYLKAVLAKIDGYAKTLTDSDLSKTNEKAKSIGLDWDVTKTFAVLTSHPSYHLGYLDALLRGEGLPGIF
jgi:hypothetical protein